MEKGEDPRSLRFGAVIVLKGDPVSDFDLLKLSLNYSQKMAYHSFYK